MSLAVFMNRPLPRWTKLRRRLDAAEIGDVATEVAAQLARFDDVLRPGRQRGPGAGTPGRRRYDAAGAA